MTITEKTSTDRIAARVERGERKMATNGRMNSTRKIALVTGMLFVITFITSIPAALILYVPVLTDPNYIVGGGAADNSVFLGASLELLLIIANIGTAVVLFPILKRVSEIAALGFVAARVIECAFIAVGILSLLTLVTLSQEAVGVDAGSLLLGYLMYRSGLVPRRLALLGLVAGPVLCASGIAILFGVFEAGSVWQAIATIPEFVWELSLGIYLIVKGFRPSALASLSTNPDNGVLTGVDQPAVVPSNGRVPSNV